MSVQTESTSVAAAQMAGQNQLVKWLHWAPWLILVLGFWAYAGNWGNVATAFQLQVFDMYQRAAPRPYEDTRAKTGIAVRYVDIDDKSLSKFGQWPWPRSKMGEILDRLREGGAKVAAFDIMFPESDRTSPAAFAQNLPEDADWNPTKTRILQLPDPDAVFADRIAQFPTILGFVLTDLAQPRWPDAKTGVNILYQELQDGGELVHSHPSKYLRTYQGAIASLPVIEANAAGAGAMNAVIDRDAIIRRVAIVLGSNNAGGNLDAYRVYPTLATEAVRFASSDGRAKSIQLKTTAFKNDLRRFGLFRWLFGYGFEAAKVGKKIVPVSHGGELWLHTTLAAPERRISAGDLLEGKVDPDRIKDAVVLVGTSAAGLLDIRSSALQSVVAGVEFHAMAIEQMLLDHYLIRAYWADAVEKTFALLLAVSMLVLIRFVSPFWIVAVALGGTAAAFGLSWWAFTEWRMLFDPTGLSLLGILVAISAATVRFMETEVERRTVRSAFSQYMSPKVVEEIARDPSKLKLGGTTRDLTVMFCDIRGFTSIAESFRTDPQNLTKLINRVLTPLSQSVLDSGGTIDKYIGDCIMAFWNAPLDDADHPSNAARCVLEMQEKLEILNAQLDAEGFYQAHKVKRIGVGIGLNTGPCVVGNMGSEQRFDYSALGDAVNLSARFQTLSSNYGSYIVVGEDTVNLIADKFAFMKIDYIAVKGRATPTNLFALLGPPEIAETEPYKSVGTVLKDLFAAIKARDWDAARAAIAKGRSLTGVDQTIFDTYESRIAYWSLQPAPKDWTGAWTALEK